MSDINGIKREFIIERQGKQYVLYAGLLDLAHQQGLSAIHTKILQLPSEENGHITICFAEVVTGTGTFTGIGDASPTNVPKHIAPHAIRMAETRAKARALRDATNIGVAAIEELDDDGQPTPTAPAPRPAAKPANGHAPAANAPAQAAQPQPANRPAPARPTNSAPNNPADLATPAQVRAIYGIGRDEHGLTEAELEQKCASIYGRPPAELTKREASDFIKALQAKE